MYNIVCMCLFLINHVHIMFQKPMRYLWVNLRIVLFLDEGDRLLATLRPPPVLPSSRKATKSQSQVIHAGDMAMT